MIEVDDLFDDELPQVIDDSETTYSTYENKQSCCNSLLPLIYSSSKIPKHLFIVFVISFSLVPVDSDFASSNAIAAFSGIMFPKVRQDQYYWY